MRIPMRALALAPLGVLAMLAAAPPPFGIERGPAPVSTSAPRPSSTPSHTPAPQPRATPSPSAAPSPSPAFSASPVETQEPAPAPRARVHKRSAVPAAPPDGTYVYELSRNGTAQGATTVALFRRNERQALETNEVGHFGAATENVVAAFSYADFATQNYVATYRAPFTRNMPLGRSDASRPHVAFDAPTTVRYDVQNGTVHATLDGVSASYVRPAAASSQGKHAPFVMDAPFMTSVMLVPGFRVRAHATDLSWYSLAFPQTGDGAAQILSASLRRVASPARFPKTPKNAVAIAIAGLGTIWFDPNNGIVYEAHFDALNIDARLASYGRGVETAAIETPKPYSTPPHVISRVLAVPEGDTKIDAVLDLPLNASARVPAVVLVPPGPSGDRNFDDAGPQPMFIDLAVALTARGFAVLRYDPRGSGRDPREHATWDDARSDARAALAFAQSEPSIDPSRVFALGYGTGADLALASADAAGADRVAGVVALAPTTTRYETCARKNGIDVAHPSPWLRSAIAHDPTKLAEGASVSLFVLQPGVAVCGETAAEVAAYDDSLRAANPSATIVVADDLSQFFGGRYDADSPVNTEVFFPYRFDVSTLGAIADWIAGPHEPAGAQAHAGESSPSAAPRRQPPPPPRGRNAPRIFPGTVSPGQISVPTFPPESVPTPAPIPSS